MYNIELQFIVYFTAESHGFKANFSEVFYKEACLPFLLLPGQVYGLDPDPMIVGGDEDEVYDYPVVESGIYEKDGIPTPFIKLSDISTFEDWIGSTKGIPLSELETEYTEWKSYVEKEIVSLRDNFLKLGWHIAD